MALLGGGALVIWNDVAPGSEREFNHWQVTEHLPERLALPGFLRGRRYTADSGHPRYFTLYETASAETLGSPLYLDRLNSPTPWSRQVFPMWRNTMRTACRVTASLGQGMGGWMATVELGPDGGRAEGLRDWLTESALPRLVQHPEVVGAHLCEADAAVSQIATAEKRDRGGSDAMVRWVVLVEGVAAQPLEVACREGFGRETLRQYGGAAGWHGLFRLVYAQGAVDEAP
jgi:hypothetical protein